MNNFEDFKNLWKNQKIENKSEMGFDQQYSGIIAKLKKFQKEEFRRNIVKTAIVLLNLGIIIWTMNARLSSMFVSLGLLIIVFSTSLFMIFYWKIQFRISKLNLNQNSIDFLHAAVGKLAYQKQFFSNYLPVLGILLVIGLNILYLGLSNLTLYEKLSLHIGMSVFLVVVVYIGFKQKMKSFKKVYLPLIDELLEILKTLKNEKAN